MSLKILYFTDAHIQATPPVRRRDNYLESMLEKLREVRDIANERDVDVILSGGDMFHTPSPSPLTVRSVIDTFQGAAGPTQRWTILGNHEMVGHQAESIQDKMMGLIKSLKQDFPFRIPDSRGDKPVKIEVLDSSGKTHELVAVHYFHGIEKKLLEHPGKQADLKGILLAHANIVDKVPPFPDYALYTDLKLPFRIILCSHYHAQLGTVTNQFGNVFVSPGALSRGSISIDDLNRAPSVAYVEISEDSFEYQVDIIPLKCAKPSSEVFDLESCMEEKQTSQKLDEFVENIRMGSLNTGQVNLEDLVKAIAATEGVDEDVKQEALRAIEKACA